MSLIKPISKYKLALWFLPYFICIGLNHWASSLTWNEVREKLPLIKTIPQRKGFKSRHIIQYGSQAGVAAMALTRTTTLGPTNSLYVALWLVSFDGLLEELHQVYVPSRIFSVKDIIYNILGGGVDYLFILYSKLLSRR